MAQEDPDKAARKTSLADQYSSLVKASHDFDRTAEAGRKAVAAILDARGGTRVDIARRAAEASENYLRSVDVVNARRAATSATDAVRDLDLLNDETRAALSRLSPPAAPSPTKSVPSEPSPAEPTSVGDEASARALEELREISADSREVLESVMRVMTDQLQVTTDTLAATNRFAFEQAQVAAEETLRASQAAEAADAQRADDVRRTRIGIIIALVSLVLAAIALFI